MRFHLLAEEDGEVEFFDEDTDASGEFVVEVPRLPLRIGRNRGYTPLADTTLPASATDVVLHLRDADDEMPSEDFE